VTTTKAFRARTPRVPIERKTLSCAASAHRGTKLMAIRRLASAILTASVRWAPPGVREWGNAMLREMDFVEGDWAALFWAFGSATALFDRKQRRVRFILSLPFPLNERLRKHGLVKLRLRSVLQEHVVVRPFRRLLLSIRRN